MLIPKVKAKEFEKFGFKKCKGEYGKNGCYYLCVSRGCKMLFVSSAIFDVNDWINNDQRIHKDANCRYRDHRTYLDIAEKTGASTATISRVNRSLNYGNDGYDRVFERLGMLEKESEDNK